MREKVSARRRAAFREGFASIVLNTILFVAKYYVGSLFNSIAVIADAFHTLSDSLTSVVLVVSYGIAGKPPDREHPFGHGRAEFIGSVVIGVLLMIAAYEFIASSYDKLISRVPLLYSNSLIAVLVASTAIKAALSVWAYRLGTTHGSQPVVADAWHHVSDTAATGLLALAVYVGRDYWWLDGVLGVAISLLILATGGYVVYRASSELLGRAPSREEVEELMRVIRETYPLAGRIHHVHFHKYGDHVEITLHLDLPSEMTLHEAHEIATAIENAIRKRLGYEATVHVEPGGQSTGHVD